MRIPTVSGRLSAGACIAALLAGWSGSAAAFEPTPAEPSDTPPPVSGEAPGPAPSRIIVKYVEAESDRVQNLTNAIDAAEVLSEEVGIALTHVRTMGDGSQLLEITGVLPQNDGGGNALDEIIETLNENPNVDYAEEDAFMQPLQANDPLFGQQWHYENTGAGISLPQGWSAATGNGAVIAVLDTGTTNHADLAPHNLPGYDFITNVTVANDGNGRDANPADPGDWISAADNWCPLNPRNSSWHGTHVAGTVAAVTNNGLGVAGVARGARIVPVRVLGKCGGNLSDIADAIRWAAGLNVPGVPNNANPADVINMSLGGGGACGATYQNAINAAVNAGTTVVVAAGNSNGNVANSRPANCNNVISVAATNPDGARSYYSNSGAAVDIAAPGGETYQQASRGVLSTLNTGTQGPVADNYAFYQGTSMAAPHVAGVAALLYELDPNITPAMVESTLTSTAKPFPTVATRQCTTSNCGAGIVDAGAAAAAISPLPAQSASIPWIKILLNN